MKAMTASCRRVRSAAPEIQFSQNKKGSILYSFLLYPLHKIFLICKIKRYVIMLFLHIKIDFWHGRSGMAGRERSWLSYPITFLRMSTYWKIMTHLKNKDGCCQLGFSVWLIFHKNNKSVSVKIMTGLYLSILSAEKSQSLQLPTFSSYGAHIRSGDNIFLFKLHRQQCACH